MGRSRRAFKRNKPKVRVGLLKRKKSKNVPAPLIVPNSDQRLEWLSKKNTAENYEASGILANPNDIQPMDVVPEESDDVRSALGQLRKDGKHAPLQRLTKMQRVYMSVLIQKHKDDFEAMSKDKKLNRMQHTQGALKKLCARFHAYDNLTDFFNVQQQ